MTFVGTDAVGNANIQKVSRMFPVNADDPLFYGAGSRGSYGYSSLREVRCSKGLRGGH